jgi:hypothetical protein
VRPTPSYRQPYTSGSWPYGSGSSTRPQRGFSSGYGGSSAPRYVAPSPPRYSAPPQSHYNGGGSFHSGSAPARGGGGHYSSGSGRRGR